MHKNCFFLIIMAISFLSISILSPGFVTAEQITFEESGSGLSSSHGESPQIQKQEAFVAAFFDALSQIGMKISQYKQKKVYKTIITVQNREVKKDKLFVEVREKMGAVDLDSQAIIVDFNMLSYIVNANYKDQKIIVKDFQLLSPLIDFLDFPSWSASPKTIDEIQIKDIKWEWDNHEKTWACNLRASYLFDSNKDEQEKGVNLEAKSLHFEFEKDISNNHVFETTTIEGHAYGGGGDSPDSIRKKALDDALKSAIEKVNGVFIQSLTEVKDTRLKKELIISQAIGIAQVIKKSFNPRFTSEGNYEIVCTASVQVPIIRIVAK